MRRSVGLLILAIALVLGACSSSATDTTTTTTVDTDATDARMCRTLELLEAAGVPGPSAALAIEKVDLANAPSQARGAYGDLLVSATRNLCPASTAYADDVAYWLGF